MPTCPANRRMLHLLGAALLPVALLAGCGSSVAAPATTSEAQTAVTSHDDSDHNDSDHNDSDHNDSDHNDSDHNDSDHNDSDHNDSDHSHEEAPEDSDEAAEATVDAAPAVAVANASYQGDYTLVDEAFGTMVTVAVEDGLRVIVSNALPNHQTGDFPNQGNPTWMQLLRRST